MPNYNQAPVIKYNGVKNKDTKKMGIAIRSHELEMSIMCGLGDRDMAALKVMLFLTGNAEGFGVAEKTICDRCNISERAYKNARKKLEDMGWINLIPGKQIIVNYDAIYGQKGCTENTSIKNEKNMGCTDNTSKGCTENTSKGCTENTHNNIKNNIKDNIIADEFIAIAQNSSVSNPVEEEPKEEKLIEVSMSKIKQTWGLANVIINDNIVSFPENHLNYGRKFRLIEETAAEKVIVKKVEKPVENKSKFSF